MRSADAQDRATPQDVAAEWFARVRIGGLDEEQREALAAWLAEHPSHLEAYEALERAWAGVESLRGDPRVLAMRESAMRRNPAWRRFLAPLAVAASLLIVAPGGAWLAYENGIIPNREFQTRAFHTGFGERSTITLPDGSKVTLNTESVVRTEAIKGRRQIYLDKGQAYFEVAHDAGRPFVVNAAGRTVTALGTAFEVRVDQGRFEVTLVEGKVRVEAPIPEAAALAADPPNTAEAPRVQSTEMVAGTQLLATAQAEWKLQAADARREVSWTTGQLMFLRQPLGDVAAELNRYSHVKIVIEDPELSA
ncbi:MAG TPA: FecR domain-containing protein, partial [Caulobacteraceae bacterium]